ncbi:MAG TPA: mechanosensitive ion channel family protein [Candidatus Poseidoniales archaeon]|nr:MAG TPA: mechanosensitive ion channel family protein [Candidatus Poseidoniales archaeon]
MVTIICHSLFQRLTMSDFLKETIAGLPLPGSETTWQFVFALLLTLMFFGILKLIIGKWREAVLRTEEAWDDALLNAAESRAYGLYFIGALNLALIWVYGRGSDVDSNSADWFIGAYILIATSLISVVIKHFAPLLLDRFTRKSSVTVSGGNPLLIFLGRAIVWFFGLQLAMERFGIELLGVLASLAVFSLIIGLAIQQSLGNIVNSFLLSLDRPFDVGDRIEVDGQLGTVASVGILSTKILTLDERLVVIPNNTLISSSITNFARGGGDGMARRLYLTVDVGVDYDEDPAHVKSVLLEVLEKTPFLLDEPVPRVHLWELADFSVNYRLFGYLGDYADEQMARDHILQEVHYRFGIEGISIPFPTSIELREKPSPFDGHNVESREHKKATAQSMARMKARKESRELLLERDRMERELDWQKERLKNQEGLSTTDLEDLRSGIKDLEKALQSFDTE